MPAMSQADALAELAVNCAADSVPPLTPSDLLIALKAGTVADAAGVAPSDAAWVPTYDMARATLRGWQIKAARASAMYDYSDPSGNRNRGQIMQHCAQMVAEWRRHVHSLVEL